MSDEITFEIRFEEDVNRMGPGRLTGTLMRYGQQAKNRREVFERGSLEWPDNGIVIRRQHDRKSPIVRAIPYVEGDEVKIDVALPNSTAGRDAAVEVREGVLTGLSVEFRAVKQSTLTGIRRIQRAVLGGAGLVDSPEYAGAGVEVREEQQGRRPSEATLWL